MDEQSNANNLEKYLRDYINVSWVADEQQIGQPVKMVNIDNLGNDNSQEFLEKYKTIINGVTWSDNTAGGNTWVVPGTTTIGDPYKTIPPWQPAITFPSTGGGIGGGVSIPSIFPLPSVAEEKDDKGNRVVKSPSPSLELILVEIAKVLRDGGDILLVREIFEKHKLKLVDHDGEVIFDPRKVEELENKGF